MSQPTTIPAPRRNAPLTGIAFKVGAVMLFLVMAALLKGAGSVPPGELVFFRSFVGIFPVVVFLAWQGELRDGFRTKSIGGHVWRGVVGTTSMGLNFFALTQLPLPEATTIGYAMPLVIVVLSALVLHEVVRFYRWTAVVVGLIGVLIIAWPRLTVFSAGGGDALAIGAIAAMAGAVLGAVAQLFVRQLIQTERSATVVLYFLISSSVMALATLPFGWVVPTPAELAMLVGAGICGGLGQVMMTESYRHADMSVVAPFEYTSLIFSVLIGFAFFGDVPTPFMWIGGVIVVGSGLFIIYREHKLGRDRRREKQVVTPQG